MNKKDDRFDSDDSIKKIVDDLFEEFLRVEESTDDDIDEINMLDETF